MSGRNSISLGCLRENHIAFFLSLEEIGPEMRVVYISDSLRHSLPQMATDKQRFISVDNAHRCSFQVLQRPVIID